MSDEVKGAIDDLQQRVTALAATSNFKNTDAVLKGLFKALSRLKLTGLELKPSEKSLISFPIPNGPTE
jgi:hypothetical protein